MASPRHPLRRPLSGLRRALHAWQPGALPPPLNNLDCELDFVMDPEAYLSAVPLSAAQTGQALQEYSTQFLQALAKFPDRPLPVKEGELRLRLALATVKQAPSVMKEEELR